MVWIELIIFAGVMELLDIRELKSRDLNKSCRLKSCHRHQTMIKFNKPKTMVAYATFDDVLICGSEKKIRAWMAEWGHSPRIIKVQVAREVKRRKT